MNWRAFASMALVTASCSLHAASPATPAPKGPATLRWKNGEAVSGELIAASRADLNWKTPLFEDPLVLRWDALRRIDQPFATAPTPDPFRIVLRNGSHLLGDLVAVMPATVSIRSARHGEVVLKRSEILSVRRIRGGSLIAAGPIGDAGWQEYGDRTATSAGTKIAGQPAPVSSFTAGLGGAFRIPYWNRGASYAVALPEQVDLDFSLRSSARPHFRLALDAGPKHRLRLETWDDELVLRAADQFKSVTKIADDARHLALRICWDRPSAQCSVFTLAGELLATWQVPEDPSAGTLGVILQNKGRDLELELLRVRRWNGKPPPRIEGALPRVELADGQTIPGEVIDSSERLLKVRARGNELDRSVPFAEIDALIFSPDQPQTAPAGMTLAFVDGTLLFGRVASVKDGSAGIETSFTEAPLPARLDGLRQLLVDPAPRAETPPGLPLAELDTIVIQQTTLHGKLTGTGDRWPRWLPVGAVAPATPSTESTVEINRAVPANTEIPPAPALFYTSSGDIVPGNLRLLDQTGVELESDLIEKSRLPADQLHAIQFGPATQPNFQGFSDPGWRVLKGDEQKIREAAEVVELAADSAIGHPAVMQANEIKFTFATKNFGTVRLRLFCAGTDRAQSSNLLLSQMGPRVYLGMESAEGQMENQFQVMIPSGSTVTVRLAILEKHVDVQINDIYTRRFSIPPAKRAGSGLILEPASTWSNPINAVSLSQFSAQSLPGRTWLPEVNAEARSHALTVPRFRKDLPPRHILLAANGDVLRGEIEALTPSHFSFRSGLETLRVPRARVKAAIWLKKAGPGPVTGSTKAASQLDRKITRQINYSNATLSTLVAFLQRELPEVKFKLPANPGNRRVSTQFGEQTIGEALDQICTLFEIHYRIEDERLIVLEPAPVNALERVQKVYWLDRSILPDAKSLPDFLASKDIPLPPGTSADWNPESRQLSMTHTAAAHRKLQQILDELGGSVSPTHWLMLINGARIGLAVDQFSPDSISGRHPQYGRCHIPLSHVYAIRTSAPPPTAAMKALEDWRLVFAPEPVLPETGGESSPALGKEAKPFKLPLLGGGDFDLAQEKGGVVVLDFWATWCGPCIKSLPALISAMGEFPSDRVKLIGINQSEPAEQVKRFIETRDWKLIVAMDAGQLVARQYGVDGIPHTVIVGPDGKVAWVKTGYHPDAASEAANVVRQLLTPQ